MLKNYLKIAYRTLVRQKGYAFINIFGLAVGLACAFLITLWIRDEVSYDRLHESGDRIYRVMRHVHSGDEIHTSDIVTWPLDRVLEEAYPEVEDVVAITQSEELLFSRGERSAREEGLYADADFFDVFSWDLIEGDPADVLQAPTSVVISASLAEKYFGSGWRTHAVGGTIIRDDIDGTKDLTVTGVFEDVPQHSSLKFDYALPMAAFVQRHEGWMGDWMNSAFHLFVRVGEGADADMLSEKITDLQNDHIEGFRSDLFLQPYADQHLYSAFKDGALAGGRIEYIQVFAVVALLIVLIACINFVNLATARSAQRAREVGVRKAVGAGRRSLVGQFMGESLLLVLFAFALALGLVVAALPTFNGLTGKEVAVAELGGRMLLLFAGIGALTALVSGTYPALYLSSFSAVSILRGTFRLGGGGVRLRKGLVVFQFAMTVLLVVGTITVYQQIRYIYAKNIGLDRENVISLSLEGELGERFGAFKEELLRRPGIAAVTSASESPLDVGSNTHSVTWRGKDPSSQISMRILSVGFDFLDVMKMELAKGRGFDPDFGADSIAYIANEQALAVMGFDDPLGERLSFWGGAGPVVGVVKDFHMASLHSEIEPVILRLWPRGAAGELFVRTEPGRTREALASLEAVYDEFNPAYPFAYEFLDETFRQTYRSEQVIGKLAGLFTVFALFIAGLGLFGLVAFTAEQRTKEIGVRKVLGASVASIVALLSKDFLKLVLIAFVVAVPVAYLAMQRWLADFAYRVDLGIGLFALAGALVLVVALVTVSYQAIRAATADPVKSLRYE